MRIVDISPRVALPVNNGTSARLFHLMSGLSERHDVRQFALARASDIAQKSFQRDLWITPSYYEFRYSNPLMVTANRLFVRGLVGGPFLARFGLNLCRPRLLNSWFQWADVVVLEYPWQFDYCRKRVQAPLVLATHNYEAVRRLRGSTAGVNSHGQTVSREVAAVEGRAVRGADLVTAVSPEDRQAFIDHYDADPERVIVVPNGADTERFRPVDDEQRKLLRSQLDLPDKATAIYMPGGGDKSRLKGLDMVRRVAARRKDMTFLVTGAIFPSRTVEGNLIGTGMVDDLVPYLQASDLSLCPIDFRGGTKIKVLESVAAGLPLILFEESLEGIDMRHGEHVWVAESNEDGLFSAIETVLSDGELRRRLSVNGREQAIQKYDWKISARSMEEALIQLTAERPARP